jgi:hypothetical protein
MTRDPIGGAVPTPTSLNAFVYAAGNPAMYADPAGLFPVDDPESAIPPWKWWELEVTSQLRAEAPDAPILTNRAARDPNTRETLRDSTGTWRRPDNQVLDPETLEPTRFVEAGAGGPQHLVQKVRDIERQLEIAGQYRNAPRVELRYKLRIGPRILGPLMIFDSYLQFLEMLRDEEPPRAWA